MIQPSDIFGVEIQIEPEGATFNEILDVAIWCDQMGVDAVYVWDHAVTLKKHEGESFECWVTLGAIAARTHQVKVGSLVSAIPFRTPSLLAYMARTLNGVSHGRAVLGLGAGWHEPDFEELGIDYQPLNRRLDQMEVALPFIRERVKGIQLLVGGTGPRTMRMAAEYADIYHTFGEPETLKRRFWELGGIALNARRSPRKIRMSVGTKPQEFSRIQEFRDVGVDVFTLSVKPAEFRSDLVMAWLDTRMDEWVERRAKLRRSR